MSDGITDSRTRSRGFVQTLKERAAAAKITSDSNPAVGLKYDEGKPSYLLVPFSAVGIVQAAHPFLIEIEKLLHKKENHVFDYVDEPFDNVGALAAVFNYGAKKYDPFNWQKGIKVTRLIDAAIRHYYYYPIVKGEEVDQESGLPHRWHCYTNLIMAKWMIENKPEFDDRYEHNSKT